MNRIVTRSLDGLALLMLVAISAGFVFSVWTAMILPAAAATPAPTVSAPPLVVWEEWTPERQSRLREDGVPFVVVYRHVW